jgi:adenosylhomocysteine nucleosidase
MEERAAAPSPVDVGIVMALAIEANDFARLLRNHRSYHPAGHRVLEGELGDRVVAIVTPGVGRAAARRGAELLLAGHDPRWLISAGFAGALDPGLAVGDVLIPREVLESHGARLSIDFELAPSDHIKPGRLLTVDAIVQSAREKQALRDQSKADAVDMETAAVAALAAERRVRFLAVRAISDVADRDLPPEILSILGPTGGFRFGAAVGALWRKPARLGTLIALRDQAHLAARRLATVLQGIVPQLS